MIYTDFYGEKLSLLGFGTMRLPLVPGGGPADIDEKTTADMVRYAMDHGVNYFDTAYPYHGGMSERVIGRALKDYDRQSFYLATKYPGHQISDSRFHFASEWTTCASACTSGMSKLTGRS